MVPTSESVWTGIESSPPKLKVTLLTIRPSRTTSHQHHFCFKLYAQTKRSASTTKQRHELDASKYENLLTRYLFLSQCCPGPNPRCPEVPSRLPRSTLPQLPLLLVIDEEISKQTTLTTILQENITFLTANEFLNVNDSCFFFHAKIS